MEFIKRYIQGQHIITTYVLHIGDIKVAVDPGPPNSFTHTDADIIICTHIHNDHCGAAGHTKRPVYVHERYVRHLVDPSRLWQATRETLGPIADLFGQPVGATEVRPLRDGERLFDAIDVYFTPGHAPHHVMFYYRDGGILFVGDGAGVYVPEIDAIFPTTPAPFKYEEYLRSLNRVSSIGAQSLCFPHFTCTENVDLIRRHMEQISLWREVAREVAEEGGNVDELARRLVREDENAAKVAERGGLLFDFFLRQTLVGLLQTA